MYPINFKNELQTFVGTSSYYKFSLFNTWVLTDGTKYVAESLKCFWLMENIMFGIMEHRRLHGFEPFVAVKCTFGKSNVKFLFTDGNNNELKMKRQFKTISTTDTFPITELTFWIEKSGNINVIYLPSEH